MHIAQEIKRVGNESFGRGDYYDALWKYEHSLCILRSFPPLVHRTPALFSNISAVCLKLGDNKRTELLAPREEFRDMPWYSFGHHHQMTWYCIGHQYAHMACIMDPDSSIAYKVRWLSVFINLGTYPVVTNFTLMTWLR